MANSNEPKVGIKLEGETLRFFEQLVSEGLATVRVDHSAKGQPYATIHKTSEGNKIIVHAQAFAAAEDNLITAHQAFAAAEDGTPL